MGENTKHVGRNSALFSHYRVRIYRSKTTRIFRRVQKNRSIGRSMRLESSIMREILENDPFLLQTIVPNLFVIQNGCTRIKNRRQTNRTYIRGKMRLKPSKYRIE